MISLWGDTPCSRMLITRACNSGIAISRSPRAGPPAGKTVSGSSLMVVSSKVCVS